MAKASDIIKRRKHKNSKLGCPNCKKRRVKCSEDFPSCLNCIKHKVRCGYLDYSPEQIEEIQRAKGLLIRVDSVKTNSLLEEEEMEFDEDDGENPKDLNKDSKQDRDIDKVVKSDLQDEINNLSIGFGFRPVQYHNNFNNVLNHSANSISQNFDNLLAATPDKDMSIVYPVYSIVNNQGLSPFGGLPTEGFENIDNFTTTTNNNNNNNYNTDHSDLQNNLLRSLMRSSTVPQDYLINISSPSRITFSKQLPNAINTEFRFKKLKKPERNYSALLIEMVIRLSPKVSTGTSNLTEIRQLYNLWLTSFIYKSFASGLMFSCLINLSTNFLISNSFNTLNIIDHKQFLNVTHVKNILLLLSIKHYAIVIKGIRVHLNKNFDPELCSSVSYILSLMSIYDPEVSLNSINCFTNGLISVLKFNLNLAYKNSLTPPTLIPVHLKLMENIQKSIYFPGYDPLFLNEYQIMLGSFGKLLPNLALPLPMAIFVNKHYRSLSEYVDKAIRQDLPVIISNLRDNQIQQEVLFKMTSTWVRLFPSKLLITNEKSHIIDKVLYLFFKVFKKSLFAIIPQVKFYFLRDFDSPLMLDVFNFINDTEIFFDTGLNDSFLSKEQSVELKCLISYCIRVLNYFQKRLQFMYQTIIYQLSTNKLFPLEERKSMVIDIPQLRKTYYERLNIEETNIINFNTTLINPSHLPHSKGSHIQSQSPDNVSMKVDYLTMNHNGFLNDDIVEFI